MSSYQVVVVPQVGRYQDFENINRNTSGGGDCHDVRQAVVDCEFLQLRLFGCDFFHKSAFQ